VRTSQPLRAIVAIAVSCVALLRAPHAHAQGDSAAALELFEEGRRLTAAGQYEQGCSKLLASYGLVPKLGTLLNLADCYEKVGKTASAWVRFTEAATLADRAGQTERADFARNHLAALTPRLSRLVINVDMKSVEGIAVHRDGALVDAALIGTPVPVDPGRHTIEVGAPQKKTWTLAVDIEVDSAQPKIVDVPALEPDQATRAAPDGSPAQPLVPSADTKSSGARRTSAMVVAGVGFGGIVASLVGGVIANAKYQESTRAGRCTDDNKCTPAGLQIRDDAESIARVSTVLFIGGSLVAATGVVLFLTSPSPAAPAKTTSLSIGPGSVTIGRMW
jgi:serine/threonine-protein kinase